MIRGAAGADSPRSGRSIAMRPSATGRKQTTRGRARELIDPTRKRGTLAEASA